MTSQNQRKIHIAISIDNLETIITDYSEKLLCMPEVVVPGEYALWRTETVNLSVRVDPSVQSGSLRHLGFEDEHAEGFTSSIDPAGIVWERFRAQDQKNEIQEIWPGSAQ